MKYPFIILSCVLLLQTLAAQSSFQHLQSLAATERAFAAATAHLGVRNGFLTFFADNALSFGDSVGRYKDGLKRRPLTVFPLPAVLEWTPYEGDVARSGDIGYLTGPSQFRPAEPGSQPTYSGWYFSVWRRQEDGTWRVYIDLGTETPLSKVDMAAIVFRPSASFTEDPDTTSSGDIAQLTRRDEELNDVVTNVDGEMGKFLSDSVRYHRTGAHPVIGRTGALGVLKKEKPKELKFVGGEVSKTGDLGFTYGVSVVDKARSHYVRVWKWSRDRGWLLVADVTP